MSNENKLSTVPAGTVTQRTTGGGALSVFADSASFETALRMAKCLASSTVDGLTAITLGQHARKGVRQPPLSFAAFDLRRSSHFVRSCHPGD